MLTDNILNLQFIELAESSPYLIIVSDPNGKNLFFNRRAREYYGIETEDSGKFDPLTVVHSDDLV